jgi:hypothetical protein
MMKFTQQRSIASIALAWGGVWLLVFFFCSSALQAQAMQPELVSVILAEDWSKLSRVPSGKEQDVLREISGLPAQILAEYSRHIGEQVAVTTVDKQGFVMQLDAVKGMKLHGMKLSRTEGGGIIKNPVVVSYSELAPVDKFKRLPSGNSPAVLLARGVYAYRGGRPDLAVKYFSESRTEIGRGLVGYVQAEVAMNDDAVNAGDGKKRSDDSGISNRAWKKFLRLIGCSPDATDEQVWNWLYEKNFDGDETTRVRDIAKSFDERFGETVATPKRKRLLHTLKKISVGTQRKLYEVTPERLDQVLLKLKVDNPKQESWDVKFTVLDYGGVSLDLSGHEELTDITALTGLDLDVLSLKETSVDTITALRGMRLVKLNLLGTEVEDIAVVDGMPLGELYLGRKVADFSVLESLPLTIMHFGWSKPGEIKMLEGKKLTYLHIIGTEVSDISLLRDMPLQTLYLGRDVKNLSVLRHLQDLKLLYFYHTRFSDFRLLRDMPELRYLYFIGKEIDVEDRDLKKLAERPLIKLVLHDVSGVDDVSCLAECQTLTHLVVPPDVDGINELRKLENLQYLDIEYDYHWPTTVDMFWRIRQFKTD